MSRNVSTEPYRKRGGVGRFVFLQFLNVIVFVAAGAAMVWLHGNYTRDEAQSRAEEVSRFELRRVIDVFNHRLNTLREELRGIYWEQAQLASVLNDTQREGFVFYRRDHLAAFGVLVPDASGAWSLQKYYLRESASKEGADQDRVIGLLKLAMGTVKPGAFGLRRAGMQPKQLGASWGGGQLTDADAYALAFALTDDAGKPFGVVGIFRPSYVFPFCRAFGDALGAMPVTSFVLNDAGVAVCNSQAQNEGLSFKDYSFYQALVNPPPKGVVRYANLVDNNVTAAVKNVEGTGLTFVVEAVEVSPWVTAIPYPQLMIIAAAVFFLVMTISIMAAVTFVGRGPVAREPPQSGGSSSNEGMPKTDALGVELGEFTKLRRELKDLETILLEMQSNHAFVAGYQRAALALAPDADLARLTVERLAAWKLAVVWLGYDPAGGKAYAGARANWGEGPEAAFQIALGRGLTDDQIGRLSHDEGLLKKLSAQLGRSDLLIQPVAFGSTLLGLLVLAGAGPADSSRLEYLPQLAQIFATVARARESGAATGAQGAHA